MGEGSATLVWFNAPGFRVLDIDDSEIDVVVSVETEPGRVACPGCGVICLLYTSDAADERVRV